MLSKALFAVLVLASASTQAPEHEQAEVQPIPGVREYSGQMIVRPFERTVLRNRGLNLAEIRGVREAAQGRLRRYEVLEQIPATGESIIRVPADSNEWTLARDLMSTGLYEYAVPDWIVYPLGAAAPAQQGQARANPSSQITSTPTPNCPDDPMFGFQWHHDANRMASCEAWALYTGPTDISIGVCDTGIRITHEDLLLNRVEAYNAVDRLWESEGGAITPAHYHGTRTTGMVAANGNNGVGICGVGWNLKHRMLRVSNQSDGGAQLSVLHHAARTSIESGDRIANVSYHGAWLTGNTATASYIKAIGGLLVWGSGNTGGNHSDSDRDADDLLVVGASTSTDATWTSTTYGPYMDLLAPGAGIYTTDSGHDSDYATASGTSYAAPLVSGVCAMIWGLRPTLSPSDVERILKLSADDVGAPGLDIYSGYGRVQMAKSLTLSGIDVPEARLATGTLEGTSPFIVELRDLSTGVPTAWSWDFGDGMTSTLQNPTHTYTTSGAFTVSLSVSNALGQDQVIEVDYILADIIPPVAEFEATPKSGLAPLQVQFTDVSGGGPATSWAWDFGDGNTSTQPNPTHTYTTSGIHTVTLTASNSYGMTQRVRPNLIAVDFIPPVASFSGLPLTGNSPHVVQFTDESTAGTADTWQWWYGDGTSSTQQSPSHTYTAQGTYTVSLRASNAWGEDTATVIDYVVVGPGPPVLAAFTATPTTGAAPLAVQFTSHSLGNITEWTWEFGDGATSELEHPNHVYTVPGQYNVSLEVANAGGSDDGIELEKFITVQ